MFLLFLDVVRATVMEGSQYHDKGNSPLKKSNQDAGNALSMLSFAHDSFVSIQTAPVAEWIRARTLTPLT